MNYFDLDEVFNYLMNPTTKSRLTVFRTFSYDKMSEEIENLESILKSMKEIRATKLEKEIKDTEEKLKKLKGEF